MPVVVSCYENGKYAAWNNNRYIFKNYKKKQKQKVYRCCTNGCYSTITILSKTNELHGINGNHCVNGIRHPFNYTIDRQNQLQLKKNIKKHLETNDPFASYQKAILNVHPKESSSLHGYDAVRTTSFRIRRLVRPSLPQHIMSVGPKLLSSLFRHNYWLRNHKMTESKSKTTILNTKHNLLNTQNLIESYQHQNNNNDIATITQSLEHDIEFLQKQKEYFDLKKKLQNPFTEYFDELYQGGTYDFHIFFDRMSIRNLQAFLFWLFDGTYDSSPTISTKAVSRTPFLQYITIQSVYEPKSIKRKSVLLMGITILLTGKSEQLYFNALKFAFKLVYDKYGITLIHAKLSLRVCTDFEDKFRAAIRKILRIIKSLILSGCYFHYTQCLKKNADKKGIRKLLKKNKLCYYHYRRLHTVPFVKKVDIPKTQLILCEDTSMVPPDYLDRWETYTKYYLKQWKKNVKPDDICQYRKKKRTTNSLERWHERAGGEFGSKPALFKWADKLSIEFALSTIRYEQLLKNNGYTAARDAKEVKKDEDLFKLWDQYDNNPNMNLYSFLDNVSKILKYKSVF